ncbi:MAG TPA: hypothetical protein DCW86_00170 [Actinobacteria bacterium]|nr:hypothetical protein [Actinomycetota bacterium]
MNLLEKVNIWADILGFGFWIVVIVVFWIGDFAVRIITKRFSKKVLGKEDVKAWSIFKYKGPVEHH